MEDTLTHELVHAYDHCKFDVKWDDLRHHACSEVSEGWVGSGMSSPY
jgi:mitochondrial inner membrane protease ATP23